MQTVLSVRAIFGRGKDRISRFTFASKLFTIKYLDQPKSYYYYSLNLYTY